MKKKAKLRVLLTGSSGFVGNRLYHRLSADGDLHLMTAGRKEDDHPDHFVMPDFDGNTDWSEPLQGVDVVVHCAGRAHVMNEDPVYAREQFNVVNVLATVRLAESAVRSGVKRLIFISSVKVNGEKGCYSPEQTPVPADPYGDSKWIAEQQLVDIAEKTGLEVVIIRPPLVYGPGVRANFRTLMRWVSKGIPLPLAAVRARRSLVYVDNLVDFICFCLQHPDVANETFMVSDGQDLTIGELLSKTAQAMGRSSRLFALPDCLLKLAATMAGKAGIYQRLCEPLSVDISKNRQLGWQPPVTVDQGLTETVRCFLIEPQNTESSGKGNNRKIKAE
ncbi:NAD-dependent epimerase/dehydratase family protein [Oceanospirillum sediminis]|uniref:NAD-dependent epimerase/dehydratase family protein n=1 Tax=Oceanospirillum sediminis TaxID=2760088 RepID=A0A839IUB4_9GAMM|nr:NAD-dependent epimerase/dehydratase family protein [Oceanospirillum sediminis]